MARGEDPSSLIRLFLLGVHPGGRLAVPASLRWLALSLGSPKQQNLRTCLLNTSSWDSASEVLQGSRDESVLLLVLSGEPDRRREAGVSGFERCSKSIHLQHKTALYGASR